MVSEPVADVVGVTSIDEDWDLLEDSWHDTEVWLHPVTGEQEVAVDVEVATIVLRNFNAELLHDGLLVEVVADPTESRVAKVAAILALAANIVDVLTSLLVWPNKRIVAVDTSWDARPDALGVVAVLDQLLAARKGVLHRLALAFVKNSWPSTVTTGHWLVVLVLCKTVSQTVTDQDRLEIDIALLVRQDLGGEDWNVVSSVGLSSNVEVLLSILGELLEEECHKRINILSSCDSVANSAARVRVSNVDWLIEEDDRGVCVP